MKLSIKKIQCHLKFILQPALNKTGGEKPLLMMFYPYKAFSGTPQKIISVYISTATGSKMFMDGAVIPFLQSTRLLLFFHLQAAEAAPLGYFDHPPSR